MKNEQQWPTGKMVRSWLVGADGEEVLLYQRIIDKKIDLLLLFLQELAFRESIFLTGQKIRRYSLSTDLAKELGGSLHSTDKDQRCLIM